MCVELITTCSLLSYFELSFQQQIEKHKKLHRVVLGLILHMKYAAFFNRKKKIRQLITSRLP